MKTQNFCLYTLPLHFQHFSLNGLTVSIQARTIAAALRLQEQQQKFHSFSTGAHFTMNVMLPVTERTHHTLNQLYFSKTSFWHTACPCIMFIPVFLKILLVQNLKWQYREHGAPTSIIFFFLLRKTE